MGIDLGTTNTCVATYVDERPVVIPNAEGTQTMPSVVAYTEKGTVLVGASARRQAVMNPTRTVHSVKRLMGQRPDAEIVARLQPLLGYEVGADERGQLVIRAGARDRSPIEVSAAILQAAKAAADEYFGEPCEAAVITCPAWFDESQRQATMDAARVAGIEVLRIMNEPTAAALAYGTSQKRTGTLVVYDWGGGTFDCSVLECSDGVLKVKATRGDAFLGGDDVDEKVMGLLIDHFYRMHGVEVQGDPTALQRLREASEGAKIELSSSHEAEIILPFLCTDSTGPKHFEMTLNRQRFEQIVAPFVKRTLECCQKALQDAGIGPANVDDVLLVGGSTKMPYVQQAIAELFGKPARKGVNPDEAVALGAAIHAAALAGEADDVLLLDVLPLSVGLAEGDRFAAMLHRGSTIPTFRTDTFTTSRDYQSSVLIKVYQGEHSSVKENRLIGSFRLENLPPKRAGDMKIDVTFSVDASGLLQVEAREAATGIKRAVQVRDAMRLSEGEIQTLSRRLAEPA